MFPLSVDLGDGWDKAKVERAIVELVEAIADKKLLGDAQEVQHLTWVADDLCGALLADAKGDLGRRKMLTARALLVVVMLQKGIEVPDDLRREK